MRAMKVRLMAVENRRRILHWAIGSSMAGILIACGGGGGDDSDDSQDLRAAIDRLQPGMNTDEVIAAVGWPPNNGPTHWENSSGFLHVQMNGLPGEEIITGALYDGIERVDRTYI